MALSTLDALVLGVVQGVTEFLPVSSSGHLVLFQHILGVTEPSITFDVFLHFATLFAVIVYFWRDLLKLNIQEGGAIVVASIPAVCVGVLFKDQLEVAFNSPLLVGFTLLYSALLMFLADYRLVHGSTTFSASSDQEKVRDQHKKAQANNLQALLIGIFQAVAVIPGVSRSGSTVAGGIFVGLDREAAFRFSFIMVIPIILGATGLQLFSSWQTGLGDFALLPFLVGGITAFLFGLASLRVFKHIVINSRLRVFGVYTGVLGVATIVLSTLFT